MMLFNNRVSAATVAVTHPSVLPGAIKERSVFFLQQVPSIGIFREDVSLADMGLSVSGM